MSCHFLLQGIFVTQGLNPHLLHCGQILYYLSHQGSLVPQQSFKNDALGILVSQPGIKYLPPAVEMQSLYHWATTEGPQIRCLKHQNSFSQFWRLEVHSQSANRVGLW